MKSFLERLDFCSKLSLLNKDVHSTNVSFGDLCSNLCSDFIENILITKSLVLKLLDLVELLLALLLVQHSLAIFNQSLLISEKFLNRTLLVTYQRDLKVDIYGISMRTN